MYGSVYFRLPQENTDLLSCSLLSHPTVGPQWIRNESSLSGKSQDEQTSRGKQRGNEFLFFSSFKIMLSTNEGVTVEYLTLAQLLGLLLISMWPWTQH
jgi:hypothetical protein